MILFIAISSQVQTNISLRDLQNILQNMGEECAAAYIQQILLT
jgi:hypothetical protein